VRKKIILLLFRAYSRQGASAAAVFPMPVGAWAIKAFPVSRTVSMSFISSFGKM